MHTRPQEPTRHVAVAVALVATLAGCTAACGQSTAGQTSGGVADANAAPVLDDAFVGCTADPRADVYQAGITKASQDGKVHVILLSGDPAPPAYGANTWTVRVEDGAGATVPGATITATPFMPDHGHGSSIVPVVTDVGGGTYTVSIYLSMTGLWRIGLAVSPSGSAAGSPSTVNFFYCIQA